MSRAAVLCGLGGALPERAVSNEELAKQLDTSDRWIRTRTSPGPTSVSGLSTRVRTSGSPVTEYSIART